MKIKYTMKNISKYLGAGLLLFTAACSQTQVDARQTAEHGKVLLNAGNVHDGHPSAIGHAGQLTGNREFEDARAGLQAEYFSDLGA